MNRVIIAALGSGSGKTLITCGILKYLKSNGYNVRGFKCGPDYIDPMFHKNILGVPSENIDTFFSDDSHIKKLLLQNGDSDITIIEGAMGIYDGLGGVSIKGSAYDLACKTNTPIVLLFDVHGMGRTMLSQIKGILADDYNGLIKGIILNRISNEFFHMIAPTIEEELNIRVLGHLRKLKDIKLESRHLGLKLPHEVDELHRQMQVVLDEINNNVDMESIINITSLSGDLEYSGDVFTKRELSTNKNEEKCEQKDESKLKLAVAQDEVFCFYYEENLRLLKKAGANLVYFSPIHDSELPEGISGILIGGGYPEIRLEALEANVSMRNSIKKAFDSGIPFLAECGGFMYLHKYITGDNGKEYEMVGAIDGKCYNTGKLNRFGYVNISGADYNIKGHEFHYFDSTNVGKDCTAQKPISQRKWNFGYISKGRLMGFPHLYYASCEKLPIDFVEAMKDYQPKIEDNNTKGMTKKSYE